MSVYQTGRPPFDPLHDPRKREVLRLHSQGLSYLEIGRLVHMRKDNAGAIIRAVGLNRAGGPRHRRGEKNPRALLTNAQAAEIRASTETSPVLATRYGVAASTIRRVRTGRNYTDPPAAD